MAHEHEQDMLRVKTPLTYCGDEAIVALSLLSGMNIFSFDNSMFGAYEQDADDGMLGIVSKMFGAYEQGADDGMLGIVSRRQ